MQEGAGLEKDFVSNLPSLKFTPKGGYGEDILLLKISKNP